MKHFKTFAFLIIVSLSIYGATKLTLQSPIVERQNSMPQFQLSKNIDDEQAYDDLMVRLADGSK